ncbi:MAG: hypothetical protein L0Z70_06225 [Chloroflexi bacterium]|nr:hypothetical protein [Chloroflexota bacterium]
MTKKPVQIYLRQDQLTTLRRVAEKRGYSVAELVRQGVDLFLEALPAEDDPLLSIVGLFDSGKGDLAEKHDDYLAQFIREEGEHE